jgi:hypothetical protein
MKTDTIAESVENVAIRGQRLRSLIQNVHRLTRHKYRKQPLWVLVRDITGFGSSSAGHLCIRLNLDPFQNAGVKTLKNYEEPNED